MGGCIHLGSSPYSSNRSHKGSKSHTRSIHKHAGRNSKEGRSPMSILKKAQHADKPDGTYCVWADPEKTAVALLYKLMPSRGHVTQEQNCQDGNG